MKQDRSVQDRASFEIIRYANCWEDASILLRALQIGPGKHCLSIASSGDNTLAMLTQNPSLVLAVDLSQAQLACLDIRKAAFGNLTYEETLSFLGFTHSTERPLIYQRLRPSLSEDSIRYWDHHARIIADGLIHQGKFENYFRLFREKVLPLVHNRAQVISLLEKRSQPERQNFYDKKWNNRRWRLLFRFFFSKFVMGRFGRDPEFFRYVEGRVAERILGRVRHALTALPTEDNPYLRYILTGSFQDALPYYIRRENFGIIKENLDKLRVFHGPVEEALHAYPCRFDAFNLSDIFEYMDDALFKRIADVILEKANSGARLAYWNMLVPRRISALFPNETRFIVSLSEELLREDRAFFYQNFLVEERV